MTSEKFWWELNQSDSVQMSKQSQLRLLDFALKQNEYHQQKDEKQQQDQNEEDPRSPPVS